jgi:hypothetical protein
MAQGQVSTPAIMKDLGIEGKEAEAWASDRQIRIPENTPMVSIQHVSFDYPRALLKLSAS